MKIAICGLWHVHAEGYYKAAAKYAEIIGVYEPNDEWRAAFCEKYDLKEFKSFDELLNSGADAAIVCTSTDTHTDIIIGLAKAGIDVFTEKVLAPTTEECERIESAIKESGIRFVISLPQKYQGAKRTAKAIAESGELGNINYFRYRNVHAGSADNWLPSHFYSAKECAGGAMIDLGAHGMYLSEWFCGMPKAAKSTFTLCCTNPETALKNVDKVEDNAVTVMEYDNGCIAISETGFVTTGCPQILEVGGENGSVFVIGNTVLKRTKETKGKETEVEVMESLPDPLVQFCTNNILDGCGIEEAKKLTKLMELAYQNQ